MSKFRNLVFEGGGVWGIAYQGVLTELEAQQTLDFKKLERVAGASAGAITACLLAVGFKPEEMGDLLRRTDFKSFEDDNFGFGRDTTRLLKEYGWFQGNEFKRWIRKQIRRKIQILSDKAGIKNPILRPNFKELKNWQSKLAKKGIKLPALYIVGSNLSKQQREIYSAETKHQASLLIEDAVRRSMSIPLYFACVRGSENDVIVDGGLTWNFPVNIFDNSDYLSVKKNGLPISYANHAKHVFNTETLGFRLDTPSEIAAQKGNWANTSREIDHIIDYVVSLATFVRAIASKSHLHKNDFSRTVIVDIGDKIKFTEFKLSRQQQDELIDRGKQGVLSYLHWFNSKKGQNELTKIYKDMAPNK